MVYGKLVPVPVPPCYRNKVHSMVSESSVRCSLDGGRVDQKVLPGRTQESVVLSIRCHNFPNNAEIWCVGIVGVMQRDVVDAPTRQLARSITFPLRDLVATGQGDLYMRTKELTFVIHMCAIDFIGIINYTILSSSSLNEDSIRLKTTMTMTSKDVAIYHIKPIKPASGVIYVR